MINDQLIINKEYAPLFKKLVQNTKNNISGFLFHDSFHSTPTGSIIDNLIYELRLAQNRGVDIKIYCHSQKQIERLRKYNLKLKLSKGYKTMHSKAWCFDNQYLLVGSHNFTENANSVNLEMSYLTTNKNAIIKYINYFNTIWSL
jgi:phosphatidylserine/phosphatidylglycerophosphate/cardiolipin synthase-like enzyme